ncbi:FkbM family methyltransferase [Benzoatithermus flavus]|uniref:FkbM family methyltransferase n=1 Tax=Benzoatithermus flavus TaxID=3108223 RepID=A0ABU8XXU6_9PROT
MILGRLARALGYDLIPRRKRRDLDAQRVFTLQHQGIEAVIDVGANIGQYATRLRAAGWRGPILSIEPVPEVNRELARRAAFDPLWEVLPPLALGHTEGEAVLEVSAESDMSSTLRQSDTLRAISPSSAVLRRVVVPQYRLDRLAAIEARPWRRLFVKIDVQGAEPAVLAGMAGLWERVQGLELELALFPLYEGERPWLELVTDLAQRGFKPYLLFPGYFARALGRQVQLDAVFYRD